MARTLVTVLLAAGVLVACSSDDDASGAPAAQRTPSAAATATTTPATTAAPTPTATATQSRGVRRVRVGTFNQPVHVTAPPGDRRRLFVVEKGGRIRVVRDGRTLDRPFLDLSGSVSTGSEQGLLSMAFAPDYATSRRFYVYFTDTDGDTRVVEYRRAGADQADARSARVVLRQDQPESNHNGGLLLFGPDGRLYIGLGDGGGGGDLHGRIGNGQNLGVLLGKILRIDPRPSGGRAYGIPRDNPFRGRRGARPEIYAYGLRNPWRFAFDRRTGGLTIGDVGQSAVEEISFVRRGGGAGANFGWRPFEGRSRFTNERARGHVRPVITGRHSDGWCSITGGLVVRDRALAGLYGRYVFGDLCQSRIWSARLDTPRARGVRRTSVHADQLVSFGEDARGRVYTVQLSGAVYRLAPR